MTVLCTLVLASRNCSGTQQWAERLCLVTEVQYLSVRQGLSKHYTTV